MLNVHISRSQARLAADKNNTKRFSLILFLPKQLCRNIADAMNGPNLNPEPETTVLHLHKFVQGTPAPTSQDGSMTSFIAKTAAETVEQNAGAVVVSQESRTLPPELMLGVVSYCYTKGVYGSEDIGRKLMQNASVRDASYGDIPRPVDIRRFRQLNRLVIQATVEKALCFAREKIAETLSPSNPFRGDTASSVANAIPVDDSSVEARREETEVFAKREASERLDKASFIDGMSM